MRLKEANFEVLFQAVKGDLKDKGDLFLVVLHWMLIELEFLCLGLGTRVSSRHR